MKYSFKKYEKLHKEKDFKNVFSGKEKIFSDYLRLYFCENNLKYSRLGISIKKSFGKAVIRNRAKRHIREFFRTTKHKLKKNIDMIFIISNEFKNLDFYKRKEAFITLLKEKNLI